MHPLDELLFSAWSRLSDRARRDRAFAAERRLRAARAILRHPPRAWCIALRACDTRVEGYTWSEDREASSVEVIPASPDAPSTTLYAQRLRLTAPAVRALCGPVLLQLPTPLREAATQLGVSEGVLRRWVRRGVLKCRHVPARRRRTGARGKPEPLVWSSDALDPQHSEGDAPDPAWGTLWQSLPNRIPDEFEQELLRVPRYRTWRGRQVQRGWDWLCPGRVTPGLTLGDDDEADHDADPYTGCGRIVRKLYAPIPPWTLADHLGDERGGWCVGRDGDTTLYAPRSTLHGLAKSFACRHCWRVQFTAVTKPADAWNLFVTQLSAGLLTGRDVPRPRGLFEGRVRHAYPARASSARARALLPAMPAPDLLQTPPPKYLEPDGTWTTEPLPRPRRRVRSAQRIAAEKFARELRRRYPGRDWPPLLRHLPDLPCHPKPTDLLRPSTRRALERMERLLRRIQKRQAQRAREEAKKGRKKAS